jgi:outer membrane receptor protein involved in Fe transport
MSYRALDNLLIYADVAQGFRDGGVNNGLPAQCINNGAPQQFVPDTVTNYELGWKWTLPTQNLLWNGALFYMPWKNFQSLIFDPDICAASSFNANIGNARVYGLESNIKYQITQSLSAEAAGSYTDSRVQTDAYFNPDFQVAPGERLPYVPYFNWSANVRYEVPLKSGAVRGYIQYDIAHKGDMWNSLQESGTNGLPRVLQPAYSLMNLRVGFAVRDSRWQGELYVTNLTNKAAVIFTNELNFDLRQTTNEPRVFGARLSYRFGK